MNMMIEGKNGTVMVYDTKKINQEINAAIKGARELYCVPEIKGDAFNHHFFISKDGTVTLSVGLIYPDGWRQQFDVAL